MRKLEMMYVDTWGDILGRHGEKVCNDNGRRLLQFSNETNNYHDF